MFHNVFGLRDLFTGNTIYDTFISRSSLTIRCRKPSLRVMCYHRLYLQQDTLQIDSIVFIPLSVRAVFNTDDTKLIFPFIQRENNVSTLAKIYFSLCDNVAPVCLLQRLYNTVDQPYNRIAYILQSNINISFRRKNCIFLSRITFLCQYVIVTYNVCNGNDNKQYFYRFMLSLIFVTRFCVTDDTFLKFSHYFALEQTKRNVWQIQFLRASTASVIKSL